MNSFFRFLLYFFAPIIVLAVSQCLAFFMIDFAISKIDIEIVSVLAFVLCLAPCYAVWHTTAYMYDFNSYKHLGKKIVFSFGIMFSIAICYSAKYFVCSDFALVCGWIASLFYCNMFFGSVFKCFPPEKNIDFILLEEVEESNEQFQFKVTPEQKLKAYKKIVAWLKEKNKNNIAILFLLLFASCSSGGDKHIGLWYVKEDVYVYVKKAGDKGYNLTITYYASGDKYHYFCEYEDGCYVNKENGKTLSVFCENGEKMIDRNGKVYIRKTN